ncbi:hypothetical protein M409DRAFT_66722 [Zasmidium cellare ATCC 36951]|uniref:Ubiquitin carboxyl-terminal hydrolase n=1 Tax=Zasmidium cellare ATCC 36951 TaxID=1080233 RepID=A0A6A6CKJ8_ZASCE|nr:uncharacterized protein M409DRAFT_66722 [Zasmidium cellare ATCC 36951]KAF2166239.1 hypothetical protein M409DRAFT_66722 [Zasmidium cellare ATCC 36951]
MPPKRGQKRKANGANATSSTKNGSELAPPDRNSWQGWVEMESEPAFFNVMLKDMGVRGVRIQEVYSMDPDILATLPQPVHAFIFLFRYRTEDEENSSTGSNQDHIWFANQIPDFACASVAMLNIVNNFPGLQMGKELRDFKDFTKDMSPMKRGDAIDSFDFVRRIHNSFATENDILNANMHTKAKVDKFKKKQAAAKALETKRAKKAAQEAKYDEEDSKKPAKSSTRGKQRPVKETTTSANISKSRTRRSSRSTKVDPDDEYGSTTTTKAKGKVNGIKDEDDGESTGLRRSGRARKPPKKMASARDEEDEPAAGFHFIAYMPVGDHVWKLDGLDKHPHDMGSFGLDGNGADGGTGNWVDVASPAMMQRMEDLAGSEIEFNLMAVVHDPTVNESRQLLENIKTLLAVDTKLDGVFDDWRSMEGAETVKDVVTGISPEFDITQADIDAAELPPDKEEKITAEDDLLKLIEFRGRVITEQKFLRGSLREAMMSTKDDDEKARHRRHDYGKFVRSWLGALAEERVLDELAMG